MVLYDLLVAGKEVAVKLVASLRQLNHMAGPLRPELVTISLDFNFRKLIPSASLLNN